MARVDATDHTLDPIKGWWDGHNLDYTALLSPNVTIDPVPEGRVVHLNSSFEWEMGCVGTEMAGFLRNQSDNPDVNTDAGDDDIGTVRQNMMTALMATGGYEFSTTEFDTTQIYNANDLLRAPNSNSVAASGGVLTNQGVVRVASTTPQSATACCGVVSSGASVNSNKKSVLNFWPIWEPGAAGL